MRALLIVGLSLTVCGSLALSWRDLRGGRQATWEEVGRGLPRTGAAWVGFPLIATGTVLQISLWRSVRPYLGGPRKATIQSARVRPSRRIESHFGCIS